MKLKTAAGFSSPLRPSFLCFYYLATRRECSEKLSVKLISTADEKVLAVQRLIEERLKTTGDVGDEQVQEVTNIALEEMQLLLNQKSSNHSLLFLSRCNRGQAPTCHAESTEGHPNSHCLDGVQNK